MITIKEAKKKVRAELRKSEKEKILGELTENEKECLYYGIRRGKTEALSGESCVKLIEQGKEIGRKEAIKRIDNLTEDDWENLIQLDSLDEIKAELKSKIGEVAK